MIETATSIRVVIPLTLRKRNGRPKILPPEDAGLPGSQGQDRWACCEGAGTHAMQGAAWRSAAQHSRHNDSAQWW